MQLSMLLNNNLVIFQNNFFKEPMNSGYNKNKQTYKPDKQTSGVLKKLLIKECLDNLTKMKDRLKFEC